MLQGLTFPLLENANEYIVHSFAYNDYLAEVDPPSSIGRVGASLDKAFASKPPDSPACRARSSLALLVCMKPHMPCAQCTSVTGVHTCCFMHNALLVPPGP